MAGGAVWVLALIPLLSLLGYSNAQSKYHTHSLKQAISAHNFVCKKMKIMVRVYYTSAS